MSYRRHDPVYRRAKAAGYRARSAYKLIEIHSRTRVLRPGDLVCDLGAWPGGWAQVALERIGPSGRLVGVDATALEPLGAPNATFIQGDILDASTMARVVAELGGPADVLLCDLAPKLTGIRARDEAACAALFEGTLSALPELLCKRGHLVIKLFMSPDHGAQVQAVRSRFGTLRVTRPDATRQGSAELYAIGLGYQGM